MSLRGFQPAAVDACVASIAPGSAALLVLATGTGKTRCGGEVILRRLAQCPGMRVLWLVQRIVLVDQAAESLRETMPGVRVGIEQADRKALSGGYMDDQVIVASVDTVSSRRRMAGLLGLVGTIPGAKDIAGCKLHDALLLAECERTISLAVVDEAHCGIKDRQYHRLYCWLGSVPRLGLTATPHSSDGSGGMGEHWRSVAYEHSLGAAIEAGDLVPLKAYKVPLSGIDLGDIDFNRETLTAEQQKRVEEAYEGEQELQKIASVLAEGVALNGDIQIPARPALVFCVSTKHSASLAMVLRRWPDLRVEHTDCYQDQMITGGDGKRRQVREEHLRRFKTGGLDVLLNFGLYHTGMDAPGTRAVVFCAPQNRRRYCQAIGRVTRWCCADAWKGGTCTCGRHKTVGEVWDFYPDLNTEGHPGISGIWAALAPAASQAELEEMDRESGGDSSKAPALATQVLLAAQQARAKAKASSAKVEEHDLIKDDPLYDLTRRLELAGLYLPGLGGGQATRTNNDRVADIVFPQHHVKLRQGLWRRVLTDAQARWIVAALHKRRAAQLATIPQIWAVSTLRHDSRPIYPRPLLKLLTFKEASSIMRTYTEKWEREKAHGSR